MRSKVILKDLEDALVIYQYLYMNPDNRITVNNGMTDLEIRLDENLQFYCKNLSFPNVPEAKYSEQMSLNRCLGIVDYLREQIPEQFPETFETLWDEIRNITLSTIALNFCK